MDGPVRPIMATTAATPRNSERADTEHPRMSAASMQTPADVQGQEVAAGGGRISDNGVQ